MMRGFIPAQPGRRGFDVAQKYTLDGVEFDSKGEAQRWASLRLMERLGTIRDLKRQVKFPLEINGRPVRIRSKGFPDGRRCSYTADFTYEEQEAGEWVLIIEDFKGIDDSASRLRRAVVECIYRFRIRMTGPQKQSARRRRR